MIHKILGYYLVAHIFIAGTILTVASIFVMGWCCERFMKWWG